LFTKTALFLRRNGLFSPNQRFSLNKPMLFSDQTYGFVDENHSHASSKPMLYF